MYFDCLNRFLRLFTTPKDVLELFASAESREAVRKCPPDGNQSIQKPWGILS